MVTGEQLYKAHRASAEAFSKARLRPWDFLSWEEQQEWEERAMEQFERDLEEEQHDMEVM